MSKELLNIFNELLAEWESSSYGCIQEFSINSTEDYKELERKKQDYIVRFNKALQEN